MKKKYDVAKFPDPWFATIKQTPLHAFIFSKPYLFIPPLTNFRRSTRDGVVRRIFALAIAIFFLYLLLWAPPITFPIFFNVLSWREAAWCCGQGWDSRESRGSRAAEGGVAPATRVRGLGQKKEA